MDETTSVTSSDTRSVSSPRSALFTILPSSNTSADATLVARPDVALTDFSVEGVFYIAKREPGESARLLQVVSLAEMGLEAILVNQSGNVKNGSATTNVGEMAVDRWVSLRLELRSSKTPAEARLSVDGVTTLIALPAGWKPGPISVRFGISETSAPTTGWVVHWDDIVIRKL